MVDTTSGDVLEHLNSFFSEPVLVIFDQARAVEAVEDSFYSLLDIAEPVSMFVGIIEMVRLEPFDIVVEREYSTFDFRFKSHIQKALFCGFFFSYEDFSRRIFSFSSIGFAAGLEDRVFSRQLIFEETVERIFGERDEVVGVDVLHG